MLLGGRNGEGASGITVDNLGNAYITGQTNSPDFPTTPGAFKTSYGYWDIFVTKLDTAGNISYSTFLGTGYNNSFIAVDIFGNAYIAGNTWFGINFPTTSGAYDVMFNGIFITKLNPTGSALVYSTFLGGSEGEHLY